MLDQLAAMVGVCAQEREEARQRIGHGVEPGDEEEVTDVEDLLARQLLAVDLGGVEAAEDVVARFGEPLVEDLVEVRVELLADVALDLQPRLGLHVDGARTEDAVLEPQEGVELLPRQSHQPEEHGGGERLGELVGEVAFAPIDELVDEVVDPVGDVTFDGVHLLGREDRVEDLAVLEVLRWVDAQRDERPHVPEVEEPLRREHLVVLERGLDRGTAGDEVHARHRFHHLGFDEALIARLWITRIRQRLAGQHDVGAWDGFLGRSAGDGLHRRLLDAFEPGTTWLRSVLRP